MFKRARILPWIFHMPVILQYMLITEAAVVVDFVNTNQDSFVCGSSENLVCSTDPAVAIMSWIINGQEEVSCDIFACLPSHETADYLFTFDRPAGLFTLEIKHVTQSDNGTVYACNDGTDSDSVTAVVQVMDDLDSTKTEPASNNGGGNTELIVTTGCLNPGTARNTQFKWICIPESSSDQKEISDGNTTRENGTVCTADPDCGIAGLVQKEATLTSNITNNDDGELCSISVLVSYGGSGDNETIVFDTNVRIKFSDVDRDCGSTVECIIAIVFCPIAVVILLIIVCCYCKHQKVSDHGLSASSIILIIVCVIAVIFAIVGMILAIVCCVEHYSEKDSECGLCIIAIVVCPTAVVIALVIAVVILPKLCYCYCCKHPSKKDKKILKSVGDKKILKSVGVYPLPSDYVTNFVANVTDGGQCLDQNIGGNGHKIEIVEAETPEFNKIRVAMKIDNLPYTDDIYKAGRDISELQITKYLQKALEIYFEHQQGDKGINIVCILPSWVIFDLEKILSYLPKEAEIKQLLERGKQLPVTFGQHSSYYTITDGHFCVIKETFNDTVEIKSVNEHVPRHTYKDGKPYLTSALVIDNLQTELLLKIGGNKTTKAVYLAIPFCSVEGKSLSVEIDIVSDGTTQKTNIRRELRHIMDMFHFKGFEMHMQSKDYRDHRKRSAKM